MKKHPLFQFKVTLARRTALSVGGALAALALAGCASLTPKSPEEQVRERAEAHWKALVAGDFAGAYNYLVPSYRAIVKAPDYERRFGSAGRWTNAIVHSVDCEAEACKVRLRITSQVLIPRFAAHIKEVNTYVDETWVREDGQWWKFQPT